MRGFFFACPHGFEPPVGQNCREQFWTRYAVPRPKGKCRTRRVQPQAQICQVRIVISLISWLFTSVPPACHQRAKVLFWCPPQATAGDAVPGRGLKLSDSLADIHLQPFGLQGHYQAVRTQQPVYIQIQKMDASAIEYFGQLLCDGRIAAFIHIAVVIGRLGP